MRAIAQRLSTTAALAALLACGRGDLESPAPERRAAAVRAAGARGRDNDLTVLLVAQRDPSALVRRAAAEAFAARPGPRAAEALGKLLGDPDADVVEVAAGGLAAMPNEPRARESLLAGYAQATPAGRARIADALDRLGTSLREAVEAEARAIWERNLSLLGRARGAVRAGAAEELGASARAEAIQRLVPLLDPKSDRDPALLAAAARGLGDAGDWSVRRHLEPLLDASDASVAEAAAEALGRLGDPGAADALAAAAADGAGRLAGAATEALGALPPAAEVGLALCEVATRAAVPAVAARAARQARLRDAACPERPLLARLSRPGAQAALAALPELGLGGAAAQGVADRLTAMLDGKGDPALRSGAARALGRMSWSPAGPALLRRLVAVASRVADARAGREGAAVRLVAGDLRARDAGGVRADLDELVALSGAAGRLRADGAEKVLMPLSRDPEPDLRAGAVDGLAALGTDTALGAVSSALDDPAPQVRLAAAEGLGRAGPRGVAPLARAARKAASADPEWRSALARALGETGAPEAVAPLSALLDGASAAAAAAALGRIGNASATGPLSEHLSRPDATARVEAIEALGQLASQDGAAAIAAQLTSDRPDVRAAAARAIGRLRYEPAALRLEALRSDYDGRVRRAAIEALAKLPTGAPRGRR